MHFVSVIDFVNKMPSQLEDNPCTQQNAPDKHHVDLPKRNEEEKKSEREVTYLDRFLKLKPMKCGTPDSDKAKTWIKNIKKKLDILKVPAKNRIKLATHVMEGTKTYRDIVNVAYALEQDHLSFLKKKASAGASGGNKDKTKVRKEFESSSGSRRPSKRQGGLECYTYGEFGHISPKCPKREGFGSAVVNRPQVQQGAKTETVQQPLKKNQYKVSLCKLVYVITLIY
ncbi:hypothetical protein ACFXTO_014482 [Malus domestica]